MKTIFKCIIWILFLFTLIFVVHELSHIVTGNGLDTTHGWYGLEGGINFTSPSFLLYVNYPTSLCFASGLIGSLLFIIFIRKYMSNNIFLICLFYTFYLARWDYLYLYNLL